MVVDHLDHPRRDQISMLAVAAVAFTVPFPVSPVTLVGQPVYLFDLLLASMYLIGAWALFLKVKRNERGRIGALNVVVLAFLALLLLAFMAHPSGAGALLLLRVGAGAVVAWTVSGMSRRSELVVAAALLASASLQSAIAIAQFARRGPVGLSALGEGSYPLNRAADLFVPRGTFFHQYPLSTFCFLAAIVGGITAVRSGHRWPWLLAVVIVAAPLGITFSRSAVVGLAMVVACLGWAAWRYDHRYLLVVLCLAVGFGVPAALARHGWAGRAYQTVHSSTVNAFSSGRVSMYHDSVTVAAAHPILGVGPARYAAIKPPVNDVPLLVTDEAGVGTGLAVVALIGLLGARAFGTSSLATAVYVALLPFLTFDYFLFGIPEGPVMAGLWAGAVCFFGRGGGGRQLRAGRRATPRAGTSWRTPAPRRSREPTAASI